MKGLILTNLYDSSPSCLNQSIRLKDELEKLGANADILKNSPEKIGVGDDGGLICGYKDYDFCVYFDKDKYCSFVLEKSGLRLFNRHEAIRACDDKVSTHLALSSNGIKMPKTIPSALCYTEAETCPYLDDIERELGYPLVVKSSYGSLGKGVHLAKNRGELISLWQKYRHSPHLYQRFISESAGRDIRLIAVGGKVVAAMQRTSKTDFRSNIELGGTGAPFTPDNELISLAKKVSDILKLDYCGIDVLESNSGYLVCEVNSNAFFGGIERVTGVNVARVYAEHILNEIY